MSLHTLAQHLQRAGRGDDKVLVHMTPNEVHGLHALAKAHGGALTINPQTGLVEAGFLSSLLPMIAGFGLTALTGGAINPMTIGLITGGGTALATGSLQKGLMAGLGAYGGAGLAGMAGLGAATTAAGTVAGTTTTAAAAPATTAATTAAAPGSAFTPGTGGFAQYAYGPNLQTLNGVNSVTAPVGLFNQAPAAALTTPTLAPAAQITPAVNATPSSMTGKLGADFKTLTGDFSRQNIGAFIKEHPYATTAALGVAGGALNSQKQPTPKKDQTYIRPYENTRTISPDVQYYQPYSNDSTSERNYFTGGLEAQPIYQAAAGGLTALAVGGPVEEMSAMNAVGANANYPQADLQTATYSNPTMQRPIANEVIKAGGDANVDPYTGEQRFGLGGVAAVAEPQAQQFTQLSSPEAQLANYAEGGISHLGDYSDGGRLLRGPGDGVSDSIPASIGNRQPARLADGEFVVPARIVSEIGNGSTEAGARKLYAMMDRVQKARKKSVGQKKVAVDSKAEKLLPA